MRPSIVTLLVGLLVPGWGSGSLQGQENQTAAELALDSLLMVPVSTASKYEQKQTEAPAFVTIVTREEIRQFGYRTIEEVLHNQTGFYSANDREYAEVGFRGFGRPGYYNNKLLVLVDGHSLNDNYAGGARLGSALSIDLDVVERIEIVRGPGSSLYGARAMLGVVNLVTQTGRDLDGLEVIGDVGMPEALGGSVRYGKVLGPKADLALSASWTSMDGEDLYFPELDAPILNNGVAEGLDWERNFRGLITFRRGGLFIQGLMGNRMKGIPTGAYRTTFNHADAESGDRSFSGEARYSRGLGGAAELTLRGYADSYENDGIYPFTDSETGTEGLVSGIVETQIDVRSFGSEARIQWDPSSSHRFVAGTELLRVFRVHHDILGSEEVEFSGSFPYTILSGFLQEEFQVTSNLALTLGLRHDEYSSRGSATTPRGALVYHPGKSSTFKILAGEAFRAPNILEMHVNQPAAALLSNPDLDPERIRSLEVIWEQRLGRVATTLSAFHNEIRDLIDLVEIEAPDSLNQFGRLAFQQQNISNAHSMGFEIEAHMAFPLGIMATAGYGLQRATDQESGRELVNAPRHLLRLSASGTINGWGRVGLNLRAESGRLTLYGNETDPSVVVDITATSPTYLDRINIQLIVKNLLDTTYSTPGGFQHVQSSIPQAGRRLTLRAGLAW